MGARNELRTGMHAVMDATSQGNRGSRSRLMPFGQIDGIRGQSKTSRDTQPRGTISGADLAKSVTLIQFLFRPNLGTALAEFDGVEAGKHTVPTVDGRIWPAKTVVEVTGRCRTVNSL